MYAAIQDGRFLICGESQVACEAFARGFASVDEYRDWLEALPADPLGRPRIPAAPYRLIRLDSRLRAAYDQLRAAGYETREILFREDQERERERDVAELRVPASIDPARLQGMMDSAGSDSAANVQNTLVGDDDARAARLEPERWRSIRAERNRLLTASDKYMIPDFPITAAEREGWRNYRRSLRDVTKSARSPERVRWPSPP
jgi:hypothetical protein